MKVSLNTVKSLIDFDLPAADELVHRINQQLGGVEDVIDLADKYKDVVIVRVVSAVKHENADKLSVCLVDDGGVVTDIERNEQGLVQVVCGAPNVHDDMYAAWLPPKSTVPATYEDKEPFVLGARELRGVVSNGMLAAADELAIGTDHDGIIEIDPQQWRPYDVEIKPGASFAEAYGLNDTIIDIENKMFTHRPDLFGHIGVAREIAGIQHKEFHSPEWYVGDVSFEDASGLELSVYNDAPEKVPRFMVAAMSGIEVKPSPLWLQCALVAMGSKAINNIVDVTNYIMLLTGQPTHAYDYDKLRSHTLGVRMAKAGETVRLLNDKTYELHEDDIVIVDGEGPVGLAGVMGGGDSEVSDDTKNIVLEVANFDMYAIRKTSMRHGLFTDAVTRFNKGQSPLQNDHLMNLLIGSIKDVCDAKQASRVYDEKDDSRELFRTGTYAAPITTDAAYINARLGLSLSASDMKQLLTNVEVSAATDNPDDDSQLVVTSPFWRTDLELQEDIVEEIGRLYGFDALPRELPQRSIKPADENRRIALKQSIRTSLARSGANEVLTYSFVHETVLRNAGQNPDDAFRLSNALSPDLQYYRLSVLPSLLDKVHMNIKSGHDQFVLFELGKGHHKQLRAEDGLPKELEFIDMVYAAKRSASGSAYFAIKRYVQALARDLGIELVYKPLPESSNTNIEAPFATSRSAEVYTSDGTPVGVVGELKQSVLRAFKLPAHTAAASLGLHGLQTAARPSASTYQPLSRYPSVTQDISLQVEKQVAYDALYTLANQTAMQAIEAATIDISPVSIYSASDDAHTKTITLRLRVTSHERTLREDEVSAVLEAVARAAHDQLNASRV
ncbi:MAG TPA: phenylalanine--tRNA ligase subunit beta [Patescibacteria group bacterium]|jgi:phenylalanyl-tRNA synthetase beta chain|nr:phenylalanine--tRNA ligase subunit beta [Patescibacteria group bacterium]